MNPLINQIMVQTMLIEALVEEVETLATYLEEALPRLYEDEAEASDSSEGIAVECARDVLNWVQGGELPCWHKVN